MIRVKIERLQAGMVVAGDVTNLDGMLLMPAGCEITERHLRILRTWGIAEVSVESAGEASAPDGALSDGLGEVTAEQAEKMIARFCRFDREDPVHQEILRLLLRRQANLRPA